MWDCDVLEYFLFVNEDTDNYIWYDNSFTVKAVNFRWQSSVTKSTFVSWWHWPVGSMSNWNDSTGLWIMGCSMLMPTIPLTINISMRILPLGIFVKWMWLNVVLHSTHMHSLAVSFLNCVHVGVIVTYAFRSFQFKGELNSWFLILLCKHPCMGVILYAYLHVCLKSYSQNCIFRGPVYPDSCFGLISVCPFWYPRASVLLANMEQACSPQIFQLNVSSILLYNV